MTDSPEKTAAKADTRSDVSAGPSTSLGASGEPAPPACCGGHDDHGVRAHPEHDHPRPSDAAELGTVRAPELDRGLPWLNTDRPLSLARELKGRVVLLDFWTYCCVNCLHALPDLKALEQTFRDEPFLVIGVHSGKHDDEKDPERIRAAIARHGVEHPVVVDSGFELWEQYAISGWPTIALIDAEGYLVARRPGEPDRVGLEKAIRYLLSEAKGRGIAARDPLVLRREEVPASAAPLSFPGKVAALDGGRVAIADTGNHRVIVAKQDGEVLEVIGGRHAGFADGAFEEAAFRSPQGLAGRGGELFVADTENHAIRRVDLKSRTVSTLAGTGRKGHGEQRLDRPPREVHLRSPWDVALVGDDLFIAMAGAHQLWVLDLARDVLEVAAGTGVEDLVDGASHRAALAQPSGLHADGRHLFFADSETSAIRALDLETGEVSTLVGEGLFDFGDVDGPPNHARFQHPLGVTRLGDALYVADTYNGKVRRIALKSGLTDSVTREHGALGEPGGLTAIGDRLLLADTNRHALKWVDPRSGAIAPFTLRFTSAPTGRAAGTGGSGPSTAAQREIVDQGLRVVSPGKHEVVVSVELPAGYEFNADYPQKIRFEFDGEQTPAELTRSPARLVARAPVTVEEGQVRVGEVALSLVLCTDQDKKLCLYDRARLQVALSAQPVDTPREVLLRYVPRAAIP